ncbi:uncharacterized protein LOC107273760 [Cephus cinctus]|uniref:Integral membrane protein 2 n=1 Tax=Cephus cinctus TaxID=211228 RepID=A0AAJ7CDV7_CEPCN|nr:uncharacterized protein LOC107273760 [Cephus cinctus]
MTIITKALSEKRAAKKMEQPLVVEENPTEDAKVDPEAQVPKGDLAGHYLILRSRGHHPNAITTISLFFTALLVMSIGIIGGVYIYRQYGRPQMHRFRTGWYSIPYDGLNKAYSMPDGSHKSQGLQGLVADSDLFKGLNRVMEDEARVAEEAVNQFDRSFKERFEIDLENEHYEKIDVPDFHGGRQGRFIHDFSINKTGIIDIDGHCCFVMPLNRRRVLPPRNMYDLLNKMYNGYYEVDTEVVRETMKVVLPPIKDLHSVGTYIAHECQDLPTYMLEKVNSNVNKRSASEGMFGQFAGRNILELNILNLEDVHGYTAAAEQKDEKKD